MVTQLGEIIHKDQVGEILGGFYKIRQEMDLRDKIDELIDSYFIIKKYNNQLFDDHVREMFITFLDELSNLASGYLEVKPQEEVVVGNLLCRNCSKKLMASSLALSDTLEWWNSPEGKAYVGENQKIIKRDGEVIRVFILKRDQIPMFKDMIYSQAKDGIQVRVSIYENLPSHLINSYSIFDEQVVNNESQDVGQESGYEVNSRVIVDENVGKRYVRKFNELMLRSYSLEDIYNLLTVATL